MSAARKNGGEGGGSRRLYKLVGAVVVGLAIAAAVVPVWLGGGGDQQPRVVEVEPEVLRDRATERSRNAQPEATPSREDGEAEGGGGDKWWQADKEAGTGSAPLEAEQGAASPEASPEGEAGAAAPAPATTSDAPESGDAPEPGADQAAADQPSASAPEQPAGQPAQEDAGQNQVAKAEGPYWTVMVGSFRNPDNARGLRDRLREQGFAAQVVTKTVKGQDWNRVYAGREASRSGAKALVPRLKEAGYQDMLVLKAE